MAIGPKLSVFLPDDLAELRVGLNVELRQAVNHMNADLFELLGPVEVVQLIEARRHFDHDGDALARLPRVSQGLDDRRFPGRPVKRPFDRDDVGVAGRLPQILENDIEGFVRMVDNDVFRRNGRETVIVEFGDALGEAGFKGLVKEVRTVGDDKLCDVRDREKAIHDNHVVAAGLQALDDEFPRAFGQRRAHFDPDDLAKLPLDERAPENFLKVLALFLELDFTIAQGPEKAGILDPEARQQLVREQRNDGFDGHETDAGLADFARSLGQADEAIEAVRHNDKRVHQARLALVFANAVKHEHEFLALNMRKGMGGVHRHRGQRRKNAPHEVDFEPIPVLVAQSARRQEVDRFRGQLFLERFPSRLLVFGNQRHGRVDFLHLLLGGHAVRRNFENVRDRLLVKTGDAHAVKFVEVRARYREKAHALQKGVPPVPGFFKHAFIEFEPGQLPVEKPLRAKGQDSVPVGRRRLGCGEFHKSSSRQKGVRLHGGDPSAASDGALQ